MTYNDNIRDTDIQRWHSMCELTFESWTKSLLIVIVSGCLGSLGLLCRLLSNSLKTACYWREHCCGTENAMNLSLHFRTLLSKYRVASHSSKGERDTFLMKGKTKRHSKCWKLFCNLTASAIQLIPYINDGRTNGMAAKLCVTVHHPLENGWLLLRTSLTELSAYL